MANNTKYHFLPFIRKGLSLHLTDTDTLGLSVSRKVKSRGTIKMSVDLEMAKGDGQHKNESYNKTFELVGPGDVSSISESAIMQTVPSNGDKGFCNDYLAAIEFFEEDLPWRYTPFAPNNDRLRPWISLILCKDDEFTEETAGDGMKIIRLHLNEDNYSQVLPKPSDSYLYAHVQVINPDNDINVFLEKDPDAGISRIFCPRKIEGGALESQHIHYTAFLIPSFEIGRRRGVGKSIEGVDIQCHAWPEKFSDANPEDLVFKVYYQWSFTSGKDRFSDLANKLRPVTPTENAGFAPFITADINDCGLGAYKVDAESEPERLMDPIGVPVACVKMDFSEADVEKKNSESHEMRKWMKEKLLDKSPVFEENKLVIKGSDEVVNMNEDPWVVPPIYGAKQALTTELEWDSKNRPKDWVSEQNLIFRHRIAGGLGKKVVQNNQEDFVQRAWLQVEQINALNQIMRERLSGAKLDSAARKQFNMDYEEKRKNNKASSRTSGFSTDSFIKTIHLSNQPNLKVADVVDGHLKMVESYAMGEYSQSSAVQEDFIEALLKKNPQDSQVLKNYYAQMIAKNPVIMMAAGVNSTYKTVSPATKLLCKLFKVRYNGLEINIKERTCTKVDGKIPFEFHTFDEISGVHKKNKLDNQDYQKILIWLTGFDHYPGDKDYYDDDWDCIVSRQLIDKYCSTQIYSAKYYESAEKVSGSYSLSDNVLPFNIVINGSDEKGFMLPDVTYQRFFRSLIDGETNKYGLGVEYLQGAMKKIKKKTVYFFPASAAVFATGKLAPQSTIFKNKDGRHSAGDVDLSSDEYYIGELFDSIIDGDVIKGYDFRQEWEQKNLGINRSDYCFVLPPAKLGEEYYTRFFSRYGTVCQIIKEIEGWNISFIPFFNFGEQEGNFKKNGKKFKIIVAPKKMNGWLRLTTSHKYKTSDGKEYETHKITFHNCLYNGMIYEEKGRYYVSLPTVLAFLKTLKESIEKFAKTLYEPDTYEFNLDKVPNMHSYNAWSLIKGDDIIVKLGSDSDKLWNELLSERAFWDKIDKVCDNEKPAAVPTEQEDKPLIDPSKEAMDKLTEILTKYYGSGKHVDIEKLLRSKYPVMAYPEFPDPTYFYLRELSERFILPSAGELPQNSISLFMSNAKFEEAFLSGMNTEMGRELLWREYPTDERGSYFRKFWDSEDDPTMDSYWDVKRMDEWKGSLGSNHVSGKGSMLIFAIRGELLQCYPQTFMYLTRRPEDGFMGATAILPVMSSWLTGDTFIAGFRASDLGNTDVERIKNLCSGGFYLTLQERDSSMHFNHVPDSRHVVSGSASWARSRLYQPMIWAMPCSNIVNL